MAENARTPVAVRIVRPYETEDEFLENELETVGKTSVILIGAHSRPTGVILRFEVTLASGTVVLRGEGRVLAHKENAFRGQPGLGLRFTRLDPRSKALVDRAAAVRDARANGDAIPVSSIPSPAAPVAVQPSAPGSASRPPGPASRPPGPASRPPMSAASGRSDPTIAAALSAPTPAPAVARPRRSQPAPTPALTPPPAVAVAPVTFAETAIAPAIAFVAEDASVADPAVEPHPTDPPSYEAAATDPPAPISMTASTTASVPPEDRNRHPSILEAPPERDDLLRRLRERHASLPADRVEAILKKA